MPGDSTWPIILVSYMYVKKDQTQTNPKTAAALQVALSMLLHNSFRFLKQTYGEELQYRRAIGVQVL